MGVHISFVRSVELDSFNPDQLMQMILGGNGRARQFYKSIGVDAKRKENVVGEGTSPSAWTQGGRGTL